MGWDRKLKENVFSQDSQDDIPRMMTYNLTPEGIQIEEGPAGQAGWRRFMEGKRRAELERENKNFDQDQAQPERFVQPKTFAELAREDAQNKLMGVLQNFELTRKTPDAPKKNIIFKIKKNGATEYTNEPERVR